MDTLSSAASGHSRTHPGGPAVFAQGSTRSASTVMLPNLSVALPSTMKAPQALRCRPHSR